MTRRGRAVAAAAAALAAALGSGCSRLVSSYDDDGAWEVHETEHFTFHLRAGSPAVGAFPEIAAEQEAGYAAVCARLGVTFGGVVIYYLYGPREGDRIGATAGGWVNVEYLTIRQTYSGGALGVHELAHAISFRTLGPAGTRLASEGLATALDGQYGGRSLEAWRAELFRVGDVIPVDELLWNGDAYPEGRFYPQAGSFVRYLLERFGAAPVRAVFTARPADFRPAFAAAAGEALDAVFAQYVAAQGLAP